MQGEVAGTLIESKWPDAPVPQSAMLSDFSDTRGDSPGPHFRSSPLSVAHSRRSEVPLVDCPDDTTGSPSCRVHWHDLLISTAVFNAFQNAGNLYTGYWYRWETTHGKFVDRWFNTVEGWRWDKWSDNNPLLDDYVGHPMMGALTNYLWIQNDPKGMTLEQGNDRAYWRSRMRALAFSTAYSFEWKLGPFGEATIGHNGDHYFYDKGVSTNETGWVELVTTPVGGLLWTLGEDALDKHLVREIEEKPRKPLTLLAVSFLTPAHATANIFRFRPPWYRDDRPVKADSFWSEPAGPADESGNPLPSLSDTPRRMATEGGDASASVAVRPRAEVLPIWPRYGGVHEFGNWWGLSLMSGHIWGYAKDVKYMPIDLTYSYLLHNGERWQFRYAPELTALAMLDEPQPGVQDRYNQRKRSYGSGLSPVGWRASFLPHSRIQPFVSGVGGFIYFDDRVLSPQGSQWMYTIDYGAGFTFFRKARQAVSVGYRYQHLSNANISHHNPGTDANTFYIAVSRFRTKGYR